MLLCIISVILLINHNNSKRALVARQYTKTFSSTVQRVKHGIKQ